MAIASPRLTRYAVLISTITAGMALDLHVRQRYPVFGSMIGGLFISAFVLVAVAHRREWFREWNEFRG